MWLQIFLYLQVFTMGVFAAIAVRHAREHFRPSQREPEIVTNPAQAASSTEPMQLPREVKERLLQSSQAQFETVVKNSAAKLQEELGYTNSQVNDLVMRLATDVVNNELQHYKSELAKLQSQVAVEMGGVRYEVAKHQEELKAKMAQEIETEKQRLLKQIDTKLADAVGSFLSETLGHNVDLGSQSSYLIAMLEQHKDDFKKEVSDENRPAS